MLALKTWGSQKWKNLQWMHWSNAGDRSCIWLTVNSWWRCVCEIGSWAWCSESHLFLNSIGYAEIVGVVSIRTTLRAYGGYVVYPTFHLGRSHCINATTTSLFSVIWFVKAALRQDLCSCRVTLPQLPPEWKKAVGSLWHSFIAQLFCWLHST